MIKKAEQSSIETAAELAFMLWSENDIENLKDEFKELISRDTARIFIKYEGGAAVGFAQCQLRYDYVEGTYTSPVGYLEGIFVKEEFRHKGYAGELLAECEKWAQSCRCKEFASDCEIDNTGSLRFHEAMGFAEANRIICFTKKI